MMAEWEVFTELSRPHQQLPSILNWGFRCHISVVNLVTQSSASSIVKHNNNKDDLLSKISAAEPVTCILCSFSDCDPQYLGSFSPLWSLLSILRDQLGFQLGPLLNLIPTFNMQYLKEPC